jgi:hypothetical protein
MWFGNVAQKNLCKINLQDEIIYDMLDYFSTSTGSEYCDCQFEEKQRLVRVLVIAAPCFKQNQWLCKLNASLAKHVLKKCVPRIDY